MVFEIASMLNIGAKFPQVVLWMFTYVVAKLAASVTKQVDLLGSQVAAWDLGEDVAVKEAGQDEPLGLGVPVKVRALKYERRWKMHGQVHEHKYETLSYNVHTNTMK